MMMKTVVLASVLASAAAFAPVSQSSSKAATVLNEFAKGYPGAGGPESANFDPLKLSEKAPEWLPWYREAELKHSRAAMLAFLGLVVPEFVRVPGEQFSFSAVPRVIDAHDALPDSMGQIFLWISFLEACSFAALANMNEFDRAPGNFGFDPLNLYPKDAAKQTEMQVKELKNGRLAMIAVGGMVTQAALYGKGFPYI